MSVSGSERRIDILAQSKAFASGFLEDRRSVYWIDRRPPQSGSDGITVFTVTPRVDELSRHKNANSRWKGDKLTPIWPVSEGAKSAEASARVSELASFKPVHKHYRYERSVYTTVPEGAKTASATARIEQLSVQKPHKVYANSQDMISFGDFSEPINRVSSGAMGARLAPRVEVLSEHKSNHPMYKGERGCLWPVSENAQNASATLRLQQLSRPKSGRLRVDDYDPYKVTFAARTARASPRVMELSAPLPRKTRVGVKS